MDSSAKIFVGGLDPSTTQDVVQKYFEQFGELQDCIVLMDKITGKSRGFAFVTFKDSKVIDDVVSQPHYIDSKQVDCKKAVPSPHQNEAQKSNKVFVGGLSQSLTEDIFRQYFEQFGTIEDSVIMVDKDSGKSRGFGFVTFSSEDAVDRVIEKYNDHKIDGKWVECKRTMPRVSGQKNERED